MQKLTWKSLGWFMMCLCALTFTACGDDDSGSDNNGGGSFSDAKSKVIGTWEIVSSNAPEAPVGTTCTFSNDGTGYWTYGNQTSVVTYTYASNNKFTQTDATGETTSGTLIISGDVASFSFTLSGSSTRYSITLKKTSGGNNESQEGELTVNMTNLAGTWQAIYAKGTSDFGIRSIDTKRLGGLDSLAIPVLMILNADNTFISYNPKWEYPHSADDNWPVYTWKQGDNKLPNGDGTILLIGKQMQLIDSYRSEYALSMSIQSLTAKRLVVQYTYDGENCTVTYGRDADGADYFSSNPSNSNEDEEEVPHSADNIAEALVGTWDLVHEKGQRYDGSTMTEQWDEDVPAGNVRIVFDTNGTWTAFLKYSNSWHEDSTGSYYMSNGELVVTGMEGFSLISYQQNEIVIRYSFSEDKGSYVVTKYYQDTLRRLTIR